MEQTMTGGAAARRSPEFNEISSISTDFLYLWSYATTMLVESRRNKSSGCLSPGELAQLEAARSSADKAFRWSGMQDSQRLQAHICRGLTYRNLAEFTMLYDKLNHHEARNYFELAAQDFYFATVLDACSIAAENLAEVEQTLGYRSGETATKADVQSLFIDNSTVPIWTGDGRLLARWEEGKWTPSAVAELQRQRQLPPLARTGYNLIVR
jgi:hypothetical protein